MSARKDVANAIKADNAGFIVHEFPKSAPENIPTGKVWINVYRESFAVNDSNSQITHFLKVLVVIPNSDSIIAEDQLDTAIDKVMISLEKLTDVYWQEAQRTIVADKWQGYEISLQAIRPQIYKSQILTTA